MNSQIDQSLLLNLFNKITLLETKVSDMEKKAIETPVQVVEKKTKVKRPDNAPVPPTAPHNKFYGHLAQKGEIEKIKADLKNKFPSLSGKDISLKVTTIKSELWNKEKGRVKEVDGKWSKDDPSKYSDIATRLINEYTLEKKKFDEAMKEFTKTDEGKKYETEKANARKTPARKKGTTSKSTIQQSVPGQMNVQDEEFGSLNL
jgi:hypothetical protein